MDSKLKAQEILEVVALAMGDEDMFDGEIWLTLEDLVAKVIDKE